MARVFIRHLVKLKTTHFLLSAPSKASSFCSISSLNFQESNQSYSVSSKVLCFINSCSNLTHLYQIQAYLLTSGLFKNPSFSGRVLKLSSNLCDIDYTLMIFKFMEFYDAFCVNTVIKAYSLSSMPQNAVFFYFEMLRDGFLPNSFSFPPMVSACAKMGMMKRGQICHGQAVKNGVDGDLHVQNALIHLYACCGSIDVARKVFAEMSVRDAVSWNTIIDALVKEGEISIAHRLFDTMPDKNVVLWNVMITGYLKLGYPGNGLKLFREMMKMGCSGSDMTMVSAITACSRSARLKEGKSLHGSLIRRNVKLSLIVSTTLINMYSRCGRVNIARMIFDGMRIRNLVCWNTMLLGHCLYGNAADGLSLFEDMVSTREGKDRILPDEISFIGLLCACAREGLLTEGKNYLSSMTESFNVKPNFGHHWCMANLYAKVGLMQDAVEILRGIQLDEDALPESLLWARLLASGRFQGDVTLGEKIARDLIQQDKHNFSYYALLVNVYAVAGRWKEVSQTKELMKEKGIIKVPGCSLKDLKDIVHHMKVGEEWHTGEDVVSMLLVK